MATDEANPTNVISPWLPADRAAQYLGGISVGSLIVLPIPFSKVGKKRIYRIDDLEAYALSTRQGEPVPPVAVPYVVAPAAVAVVTNPATPPRGEPAATPAPTGKRKRSAADWTRAVLARRR